MTATLATGDEAETLLRVENLHVAFPTAGGVAHVVRGIDLEIRRGEMLGLVGESGSGKSVMCRSLIGLTPPPGEVIAGEVRLDGTDLLGLSPRRLRLIRGAEVAMVFQDPATALDPVIRIGHQLKEVLRNGASSRAADAQQEALTLLERVGIPNARARLGAYPHELSGGMRQRVAIALAIARRPRLLLADEPTTALDVTVQSQILDLLRSLSADSGMSVLLVSHDLGVVAHNCDRVAVMYGGHIVEVAPTRMLFARPQHPYTRALIRSLLPLRASNTTNPLNSIPGQPPNLLSAISGCPFTERCAFATSECREVPMTLVTTEAEHQTACPFQTPSSREIPRPGQLEVVPPPPAFGSSGQGYITVAAVTKSFQSRSPLWRPRAERIHAPALAGVSLTVPRGSAVGIVGESGSGKTTLARCIVGLEQPDSGSILIDGVDVTRAGRRELAEIRRHVQMIFQDPYTSLNPRLTVGAAIGEAASAHKRVTRAGRDAFVGQLLEQVGLSTEVAKMRPRRLSGGQRQRIAIARALAVGADTLIADEAVSALDVSVQAQVLNLFRDLRLQLGLTLLFISHQLAVVSHVCDSVAVMYLGRIVEFGPIDVVFSNPQHPYTEALLAAHPDPDPDAEMATHLRGELADTPLGAAGCPFRPRCPYAVTSCSSVTPSLRQVESGQAVACDVLPLPRSTSKGNP